MNVGRLVRWAVVAILLQARVSVGAAQEPRPSAPPETAVAGLEAAIDGPVAPVAPLTVNRDEKGNATIRATRLTQPFRLDGRMDEEFYSQVQPIGDFVQILPTPGAQATEKTDVWVFFDDKNLYVTARCWDSHPERDVLTELRRDSNNIFQNENFTVFLDTFYDRRNGFFFQMSPLEAKRDQLVVDDVVNQSWNTIWEVRSSRFEGGWIVELEIPFKLLRYRRSGPQVWGINFRRVVRWKNEFSSMTPVPAQYSSGARLEFAGTVVGIETPSETRNLELKPYALSSVTTDRTAAVPVDNAFDRNAGFDFKYGITRGLIVDATVNTDFAQVEEDLQQTNLTRFNVQFPEKRDFFLEGQGLFSFGGVSSAGGGTNLLVPVMFFSRRIGLSQGQSVPVPGGGRLTGKAGPYSLGILNIETADKPAAQAVATNFSVFRLKRDVLRKSNIGVIATRRTPTAAGQGSNLMIGVDTNLYFFSALQISNYFVKTDSPGVQGDDTSYRTSFNYSGDRYGLVAEHLMVGHQFNPEVGFLRRADFRRTYLQGRISPRLQHPKATIRRLIWQGSTDYITNARASNVENRENIASFGLEFDNSDTWTVVQYTGDYEWLPRDFTISPGVVVPAGGHTYRNVSSAYTLGQQQTVSGTVSASYGSFYEGTNTAASYSGRIGFGPRFAVEPGLSLNWVHLPYGDFTARLLNARFIVTPNPRMFISSLVQYNAIGHSVNSSVRLRWEYTPGSELFLVYSDGRDTAVPTASLMSRSLAIKVTRLFRF